MTDIQKNIAEHVPAGYRRPDNYTLRCFVGMIETGEATLEDFAVVGGETLAAKVEAAMGGDYAR